MERSIEFSASSVAHCEEASGLPSAPADLAIGFRYKTRRHLESVEFVSNAVTFQSLGTSGKGTQHTLSS